MAKETADLGNAVLYAVYSSLMRTPEGMRCFEAFEADVRTTMVECARAHRERMLDTNHEIYS